MTDRWQEPVTCSCPECGYAAPDSGCVNPACVANPDHSEAWRQQLRERSEAARIQRQEEDRAFAARRAGWARSFQRRS